MTRKKRKAHMRRCPGCMESKPKNELLRIACYEGVVSVDPTGKAKGRGIYICPSEECLAKAKKRKALQRSFGTELTAEQEEQLLQEIREYDAR